MQVISANINQDRHRNTLHMNRLTRCLDTNDSSSSDSEDGTPHPITTKHCVGFDPHVFRLLVNHYTASPLDAPPSPNSRPPRYDGRCGCCGLYGHPESKCEQLARFLWISKYAKNKSSDNFIAVLRHWDKWYEANLRQRENRHGRRGSDRSK